MIFLHKLFSNTCTWLFLSWLYTLGKLQPWDWLLTLDCDWCKPASGSLPRTRSLKASTLWLWTWGEIQYFRIIYVLNILMEILFLCTMVMLKLIDIDIRLHLLFLHLFLCSDIIMFSIVHCINAVLTMLWCHFDRLWNAGLGKFFFSFEKLTATDLFPLNQI